MHREKKGRKETKRLYCGLCEKYCYKKDKLKEHIDSVHGQGGQGNNNIVINRRIEEIGGTATSSQDKRRRNAQNQPLIEKELIVA